MLDSTAVFILIRCRSYFFFTSSAVLCSCETVAKIELCSKSLARHLVAAPCTFSQMFSSSVCSIPRWRRRRRWYGGGSGEQNEGEKRFFDKGSLGPGAFAGDHLYLFFCVHAYVCACVIRGYILNIICIYVLYFSCHFFPIPFGRGAAAAHISILRCYYYTMSEIPNPLKKEAQKKMCPDGGHMSTRNSRASGPIYIFSQTQAYLRSNYVTKQFLRVTRTRGVVFQNVFRSMYVYVSIRPAPNHRCRIEVCARAE